LAASPPSAFRTHFYAANVEFADASDAEVRKVVGLGANSFAVQGIRLVTSGWTATMCRTR
jgi:hypothetical protein